MLNERFYIKILNNDFERNKWIYVHFWIDSEINFMRCVYMIQIKFLNYIIILTRFFNMHLIKILFAYHVTDSTISA